MRFYLRWGEGVIALVCDQCPKAVMRFNAVVLVLNEKDYGRVSMPRRA
jgi:hypothetical protein